ncbi:helix-turn-helix transcriptional regulator [Paenibacillus sp. SI8]|uniref:helix-turn-helix transcriptional regulator n=1 Tax=unclassified Paenibacillus TaxID=185978 RepID=UPI0034661432
MSLRYAEIYEVIKFIHRHIDEPLSRLARYVSYSPFHFTRIFKEETGLTPQHYISSLRLQKAKDLLLRTNLNVRDISLEIGQQSLGTFTTRFTERVGVTPFSFRSQALQADNQLGSLKKLDELHAPWPVVNDIASIKGTIRTEIPFEGVIFIGLFAKPIPEGLPLHGTLVFDSGEFSIADVNPGTYYLMATSVTWGMRAADFLLPHTTLRGRKREPIFVYPFTPVPHQEILLSAPRLDDPPILISLHVLMSNFLQRTRQNSNR